MCRHKGSESGFAEAENGLCMRGERRHKAADGAGAPRLSFREADKCTAKPKGVVHFGGKGWHMNLPDEIETRLSDSHTSA